MQMTRNEIIENIVNDSLEYRNKEIEYSTLEKLSDKILKTKNKFIMV